MTQANKRTHKVKVDYGLTDYYRYYKRNNKNSEVTNKEFGDIIKEFNGFVRDNLSKKGNSYKMPERMGIIELRKKKAEVTINDDGTIKNTLPINWQETRKLWENNPEAKEKGLKVKFINEHSQGYTFKFVYLRTRATYKNKAIYRLKFNRKLKRQLSQSIFNNTIDAFLNKY